MDTEKAFYRPDEAAKLLGLGITTIYKLINGGDLEAFTPPEDEKNIKRFTLISRSSLISFIRRLAKKDGQQEAADQITCPLCGGQGKV